jgi:hypothetical protein
MSNRRAIETVRGSGNIFRDFNLPNHDLEQLRSILAARIIKVFDDKGLSVRKAHELTGVMKSRCEVFRGVILFTSSTSL